MQLKLSQLQFFDHGKSCTLWLDPGSRQQLGQLQEKLVQTFPDCTDLSEDPSRDITEFSPHLSLGQWPSADAVQRAQKVWPPGIVCTMLQGGVGSTVEWIDSWMDLSLRHCCQRSINDEVAGSMAARGMFN